MVEQRKRYRDKKEPKKAETRRPCTRLSVHECQRTLHTVVCLVMTSVVTAEVPEYRHLRSNHVYSYRQKIALLVLREYLDLPYRRMYEVVGGHFRRRMKQFLGPLCSVFTRIYRMRAIVETTNSMFKKVFGSTLRAVSPEGRRTETFMRIIAHNVRQTVALGKSWVFGV